MTSLFAALIGAERFALLPPLVRQLHEASRTHRYTGRCDVDGAANPIARCCAAAARLPRSASNVPLSVEIAVEGDLCESWTRDFGSQRMRSRLELDGGLLAERLGLVRLWFRLDASTDGLAWHIVRVKALGMPLPARWFRGVVAREHADGGRYRFDVRAELPVIGRLVRYRGWLDVA